MNIKQNLLMLTIGLLMVLYSNHYNSETIFLQVIGTIGDVLLFWGLINLMVYFFKKKIKIMMTENKNLNSTDACKIGELLGLIDDDIDDDSDDYVDDDSIDVCKNGKLLKLIDNGYKFYLKEVEFLMYPEMKENSDGETIDSIVEKRIVALERLNKHLKKFYDGNKVSDNFININNSTIAQLKKYINYYEMPEFLKKKEDKDEDITYT